MRSFSAALLLLGLGSCSLLPRPEENPAAPAVEIAAPPAIVFEALPEIYNRIGLPEGFPEPNGDGYGSVHVVSIWKPWVGPRDAPFLRCANARGSPLRILATLFGHGSLGLSTLGLPPAHVALTVSTAVAPSPIGSRVQTYVRTSPVGPAAGRVGHTSTHCVSTGSLERRIDELLRSQLIPDGIGSATGPAST